MRGRRFCRGGMPEIGIPLQESRGKKLRQRTALEFRSRASQMKRCDGRDQAVRRVPPRLGPLENLKRPFFVALSVVVGAERAQPAQLCAAEARDVQACIISMGNGKTMVELRSPAISNKVAR